MGEMRRQHFRFLFAYAIVIISVAAVKTGVMRWTCTRLKGG
jgi:hypothetical protein